eukprot:ANDGO_07932.mRNA.1 hypothetical protein
MSEVPLATFLEATRIPTFEIQVGANGAVAVPDIENPVVTLPEDSIVASAAKQKLTEQRQVWSSTILSLNKALGEVVDTCYVLQSLKQHSNFDLTSTKSKTEVGSSFSKAQSLLMKQDAVKQITQRMQLSRTTIVKLQEWRKRKWELISKIMNGFAVVSDHHGSSFQISLSTNLLERSMGPVSAYLSFHKMTHRLESCALGGAVDLGTLGPVKFEDFLKSIGEPDAKELDMDQLADNLTRFFRSAQTRYVACLAFSFFSRETMGLNEFVASDCSATRIAIDLSSDGSSELTIQLGAEYADAPFPYLSICVTGEDVPVPELSLYAGFTLRSLILSFIASLNRIAQDPSFRVFSYQQVPKPTFLAVITQAVNAKRYGLKIKTFLESNMGSAWACELGPFAFPKTQTLFLRSLANDGLSHPIYVTPSGISLPLLKGVHRSLVRCSNSDNLLAILQYMLDGFQ